MKFLYALVLCLLPISALANSFPALFNVSGVASNDVLNIRSEPSASGAIIGFLTYNQTGVEVIEPSETGTWGLVNTGEGQGWVSLRYLARTSGQWTWPAPAACFGTEPFWSLDLSATGPVTFEVMDQPAKLLNTQTRTSAYGRPDRHGFVAGSNDGTLHAVINYAACSDGMSDRAFGLTVDLLYRGQNGYEQYAGCCTLAQ